MFGIGNRERGVWFVLGVLAAALCIGGPRLVHQATSQEPQAVTVDTAVTTIDHMKLMDQAKRRLRRSLRKTEAKDQSLGYLSAMQMQVLITKSMEPTTATEVPTGEYKTYMLGYRLELIKVMDELLNLETALLEDRHDEASELYKKIAAMEKQSHEVFRPEEDE